MTGQHEPAHRSRHEGTGFPRVRGSCVAVTSMPVRDISSDPIQFSLLIKMTCHL